MSDDLDYQSRIQNASVAITKAINRINERRIGNRAAYKQDLCEALQQTLGITKHEANSLYYILDGGLK